LSLYYTDPDGNRMELQVDACSAEEGKAFLAATDNPVGVMFDPEALVARWRGGEPEEICSSSRRGSLRRSRRSTG
jgi:hypothetical protein